MFKSNENALKINEQLTSTWLCYVCVSAAVCLIQAQLTFHVKAFTKRFELICKQAAIGVQRVQIEILNRKSE